MSVSMSTVWSPTVLGRAKLDGRRWSYLIEAPFDMDASATGLVGTTISLDGEECDVRGIVPNMPAGPILKGRLVEILISRAGG